MTNHTKEERQRIFETNFNKYKTRCYGHFSSIEFLNKYKNVILNFINKDNIGKFDIFLMTNKDSLGISKEQLNRNKHLGAQFCARSTNNITYYYFTQAIWQDKKGNYLSLNAEQCNLIKRNATDSFKVVLINTGKLYVFENFSEDIVDGHKVPVECAVKSYEICKADFRKPVLGSTIKVEGLGGVRYKPMTGNQLHAKKIIIRTDNVVPEGMPEGHCLTRGFYREYTSIVKAYCELSGTKLVNGKPEGKPHSKACYRKSYVQFRRDIKNDNLKVYTEYDSLISVIAEIVDIRKDDYYTIIDRVISDNNSVVVTSDNIVCNKPKVGRRRLDKLMNTIADKLVETVEQTVSVKDIQAYVISCGSNQHMLQALTDALNDKGFIKEALYAADLFDRLNISSI